MIINQIVGKAASSGMDFFHILPNTNYSATGSTKNSTYMGNYYSTLTFSFINQNCYLIPDGETYTLANLIELLSEYGYSFGTVYVTYFYSYLDLMNYEYNATTGEFKYYYSRNDYALGSRPSYIGFVFYKADKYKKIYVGYDKTNGNMTVNASDYGLTNFDGGRFFTSSNNGQVGEGKVADGLTSLSSSGRFREFFIPIS